MALSDQPYLPLYVKDILTDEKLIECSASSYGVYMLLLCLLHKEKDYGRMYLKQKYKQTLSKSESKSEAKMFAEMLSRRMPFDVLTIESAISELHEEGVISIDHGVLSQKRMVKDGQVSSARSAAGKKGGEQKSKQTVKQKSKQNQSKTLSKSKANSVNENEYVNENAVETVIEIEDEKIKKSKTQFEIDVGPKQMRALKQTPYHLGGEYTPALRLWLKYKKERGSPYAQTGIDQLFKTWIDMTPDRVMTAVEQSIQSNYQGLFYDKINDDGTIKNLRAVQRKPTAGFSDKTLEQARRQANS